MRKKIESEDRKVQILQIVEILKEHSSEEKPLSRKDIQNLLSSKYGNAPQKKDTVASYMNALTKYYSPQNDREYIIYDTNNEYDECTDSIEDDKFDFASASEYKYFLVNNELEYPMLISLYYETLQSKSMDVKTIETITAKIKKMLNKFEREALNDPVSEDGMTRVAPVESANNVAAIKQAFDLGQGIRFDYYAYNLKKELVKKEGKMPYEVIPLKFFHSAGKNYLSAYHVHYKQERVYRIDKMLNLKLIENTLNKEELKQLKETKKHLVFMHAAKTLRSVELKCEMRILDNVIEQFADCYIRKHEQVGYFYASLRNVTDIGTRYWILQFSSACEVLSPQSLRDDVKETLERALSWYNQ